MVWTTRLAGCLLCAAALIGCATPEGARSTGEFTPTAAVPTETPGRSPAVASTGPVEPSASGWPLDEEASDIHAHDDVPADEGDPDGDALGEAAAEPPGAQIDPDPSVEPGWVDPCTLVTDSEWSEWTGDAGETPHQELEDGDACGWMSADDDVRMAIGAFGAFGGERWLPAEDAANGEAIPDLGDRAVWLERWPIEQSSTLVVEVGSVDLVIEMSARDPSDSAALRDGALRFAELALERLP